MSLLAQQRCFNHALREAAARCPACAHFYCRECITEHEGRVICSACLVRLTNAAESGKRRFGGVMAVAQFLIGFLVIWMFFYWVGDLLSSVATSRHGTTLWRGEWLEEP